MGRRRIEIRPIADERAKSITFFKRKAGLFKKAHDLAVLCNVDVAVVIVGPNKTFYEFSTVDLDDLHKHLREDKSFAHTIKNPADFSSNLKRNRCVLDRAVPPQRATRDRRNFAFKQDDAIDSLKRSLQTEEPSPTKRARTDGMVLGEVEYEEEEGEEEEGEEEEGEEEEGEVVETTAAVPPMVKALSAPVKIEFSSTFSSSPSLSPSSSSSSSDHYTDEIQYSQIPLTSTQPTSHSQSPIPQIRSQKLAMAPPQPPPPSDPQQNNFLFSDIYQSYLQANFIPQNLDNVIPPQQQTHYDMNTDTLQYQNYTDIQYY
ncbi:hypothetical protein TBLA_0B04500 [Henningerozyma blattae CBS 6284]|uniref:MADS-box domain-containing protein n=1 Tax=Henningerozyma blattae (strain ATCC 34711 / CBS 6284 / DSM 70876 / NBRC 10599 / NRRL Y-10934 / UCD 77-7) TaxID=1071380 RepID=I2GYT4_HENB6|nr:hypothetical protein TBLA_0B04500 [Tetrapisispora blattae CBS 6284]CCH59286.1 hypothetical protein TBLA_0B04500 [Tetrapisispora blattae CBS 6284]